MSAPSPLSYDVRIYRVDSYKGSTTTSYRVRWKVGTRVWHLCETHGSLRAVWEAMQHEFDAPSDTLETDLLTFVDELLAKGLLELRQHAA